MPTTLSLRAHTRLILFTLAALCAALAAFGGTASAGQATRPHAAVATKGKITLCHRVGGPNYVVITVAPEAALAGHARNHPLDIIPAFTYTKNGKVVSFPGQNLSAEGVAILGNQCVVPQPPVAPTDGDGGDNPGGGNGGDNGGGNGGDNGGGNGGDNGGDNRGADEQIMLCHWHADGEFHEEALAPLDAYTEHAEHPRDIIPSFSYTGPGGDAYFEGQNLTEEGIALLANDCADPTIEETPVPGHPLIDLVKSAVDVNGGLLEPGDLLTFTIEAVNAGSVEAEDVVLTDPISAGTVYVADSAKTSTGTVDVADGYLTARLGTLAAGATATVAFTVRLDASLPVGATILNVGHATATDRGNDKTTESDSNLIELPVDTPPVVPVDIVLDPPTDTPYPGTEMPTIIEVTPTADMTKVTVCAQLAIPPVKGSPQMGTVRTTCTLDRVVKKGRMMRSMLTTRIPRSAAGRCIRLATSVRAAGYSPRERSMRLCVRKRSAVSVEPVVG